VSTCTVSVINPQFSDLPLWKGDLDELLESTLFDEELPEWQVAILEALRTSAKGSFAEVGDVDLFRVVRV